MKNKILWTLMALTAGWFATQACFPIYQPPTQNSCFDGQGNQIPCTTPTPPLS